MKYSKILVAYDGSETSKKALLKAKEIAEQNKQTEMEILTVWMLPSLVYDAHTYQSMMDTNHKLAEERLTEAQKSVQDLPNKISLLIKEGHTATTILDYAEEQHADLIVLGSRGLGGLQRFFLGSVSFHVVQKAHCDVLIVK